MSYPHWYPEYKAALLELDPAELKPRIDAARSAIEKRMEALTQDDDGTLQEREAIANALHYLRMLETGLPGLKLDE